MALGSRITNRFVPNVGSFKGRVLAAGSWVLFGFAISQVLRFAGNLIMTRLLLPEAFGIMAVASVVQMVIALLADVGLRPAIIQSSNGERKSFLNTAWTIQIIRGLLIWLGCLAAAGGLYFLRVNGYLHPESVYANPTLPSILAAISFSSVIFGFQSIKSITVHRRLDMKVATYIELVQMVAGLLVAVIFGWWTKSIWSFVASILVGSFVTVALSRYWLEGPRDRFAWDKAALTEIIRFGRWIFLSSIVGVLAMNGDRLLLAGWTTPTVLGYFSIASNLALIVDSIASRVFSNVSLPALAEVARSRRHQFAQVYFRMRWFADPIFLATAGFLFAAAETIVHILFDARYAPAGDMLHWLSFNLVLARYNLAQSAYLAAGKPNYVTVINVARVASLFLLVPGLYWLSDLTGAIIGIAIYSAPIVPLILFFNSRVGLNNFRLEALVLTAWPIGWVAGTSFSLLLSFLK